MTIAGKLELIQQLLGGLPVFGDDGDIIHGELTPQIITPEDALKLLNSPDETPG